MPDPRSDSAVTPVRPGDELPWERLEAHLRSVLDVADEPMRVQQFVGGRANLTYQVAFGDQLLVIRRPPRGDLAPGAHDMAREHRVLSRLWQWYPRAPRSHHYCDDVSVIGAPFVVLEHRQGAVVRNGIPAAMAHHVDVEIRVDNALIDATADLHTVDAHAAGLDDLGRADGFGDRQVSGWRDRWNRASPPDDAEVSASMHAVADELARTVPRPARVSVVHNDLKLDNCQFDPANPDLVVSVFDWDMATLGDPLFDLGAMFTSMASDPAWVISVDDALQRYAARSSIDVEGFGWYLAFATWRTAVVMQQLYNRYARGESSDARLEPMGRLVPVAADRARSLLTDGV